MIINNCKQNSPEWFKARCGIPTSSGFNKIITIDGKQSKQREKYLYQLAGERIIGIPEESYKNEIMQRGQEMEAEARQLYELITGKQVEQIGLCIEDNKYSTSPDGLIDSDGVLEIKCPILSTHVGYLLANELPSEYFQQVQGQLLITGRKWSIFMSYYPAMPPLIIRVKPDNEFLKILKIELELFCKDLDNITKTLRRIK